MILNGPNDVHARQVEAAAAAGKHCLVQKPMAHTLEAAEHMVRVAEEAGIRLGVLMLDLGSPVHHQVRELVRTQWFGMPTLIQATNAHTIYLMAPPEHDDWRRDPERVGGSAFIQLSIHALDLAQWLLEDHIVSVFAAGSGDYTIFQNETTLATVRFSGGVLGHFAGSYSTNHYGFVLCGTRGRIHLLDDHIVVWGREPFEGSIFSYETPGEEVSIPRSELTKAESERILDVEVHDVFARWLLGESDYPCPGEQGAKDMRVVDAAHRSVRERRWIDLA